MQINWGFILGLAECREMLEKGKTAIETILSNLKEIRDLHFLTLDSVVHYRQEYTIADTVLSAPRSSFPDIVKLTEKNVQSGQMHNLKVVPGYYTVETDRGDEKYKF